MNRRKFALIAMVAVGAVVIIGAIAGFIVAAVSSPPTATPSVSSTPDPSSSIDPTPVPADGAVVDPGAAALGLVPEPITTDMDVYAAAALRMPWTYDTTKITYSQLMGSIEPWFSGDPVDTDPKVRERVREGLVLALIQSDLFPSEQTWNDLSSTKAKSVAELVGPLSYEAAPDDVTGNMRIATGQVKITVTQDDGGSVPSVMESVIESKVYVLCDPATEPVPNTAQRPGDCKIIGFVPTFTVVGDEG